MLGLMASKMVPVRVEVLSRDGSLVVRQVLIRLHERRENLKPLARHQGVSSIAGPAADVKILVPHPTSGNQESNPSTISAMTAIRDGSCGIIANILRTRSAPGQLIGLWRPP